jgi:predicted PurR-regulated permease PerM
MLALLLFYLLLPINKKLILHGLSNSVAAALLSGAFFMLVFGMLLLFYTKTSAYYGEWHFILMRYLEGGLHAIDTLIHGLQQKFMFLQNNEINVVVHKNMTGISNQFSEEHMSTLVLTAMAWLPSLVLVPIIAYFLLKDGAKFRKFIGESVPNAYFEKTLNLMCELDLTARRYCVGMLKLATIDAIILTVGLLLLGAPSALFIGIIAAVLCWIPIIGSIIGCSLAIMIAATDSPGDMSLIYGIIGVFIFLKTLDGFVFAPIILGKHMSIHPLLTLMMFFIGGAINGVTGLMLVIPILAIVMVIGETVEIIFRDTRLLARHTYAKQLHKLAANHDLEFQNQT